MHTSSAKHCCRRFPNRRDRKAEDMARRYSLADSNNFQATERSTHNPDPTHRPNPTMDSNTMDSIPNRVPIQIPNQTPNQIRPSRNRRHTRTRGHHTQIRGRRIHIRARRIQTQSDCPSAKRIRIATQEKTTRQRGRRTSCCRIACRPMKLPKLIGQMSSRLHDCSRNSTSRAMKKSLTISIQPSRD
jgi:hypothetical protein